MPSPTDQKRLQAATLLRDALYDFVAEHRTPIPLSRALPIVDAIADYSIAFAIDQLTATASAVIFRNAQPPTPYHKSGDPSETF